MSQFIFTYYNGPNTNNTPMEESLAKWQEWLGGLGDKVLGGDPVDANGKEITGDDVTNLTTDDWPFSGYGIFQAESMEEAVEMAKGCPILSEVEGSVVRVMEINSIPEDMVD
jgi:hypothetical protein